MLVNSENITGIVLAGGRATRMGGHDKGLLQLGNRYMIQHIVDALRPQVQQVIINANRNQTEYAQLTQCIVVKDIIGDYAGPLAGIATGLQIAQTEYVLFVPCDSPFITDQLANRLYTILHEHQAEICVANDGQRIQMVFSLIKRDLLGDLISFLQMGESKVSKWYERHHWVTADFSDMPTLFLNINTPQDYEKILSTLPIF